MKKITAVCLAVFAWIVLTLCAGAVAFALAVTLRCIMRAWQLGWLLLCGLLFVAVGCRATGTNVNGTTVIFPLQVMTASPVNRAITITPDLSTAPLVNGTNLVGTTPQVIQPVHGVGTAVLLPWSYTYRVDGWPGSGHFQVPESTNTLNVVDLLTNAVAVGAYISPNLTAVATTNSASVTFTGDGTATNPLTAEASLTGDNLSGTNVSLSGSFTGSVNATDGNVMTIGSTADSAYAVLDNSGNEFISSDPLGFAFINNPATGSVIGDFGPGMTNWYGSFNGEGSYLRDLKAINIMATNAPFAGAALRCSVVGSITNFYWAP
jgi:hypothetical protein